MVKMGKAKFNPKTGIYIPIIVAENLGLVDGDLIEFFIEKEELILRKAIQERISLRA